MNSVPVRNEKAYKRRNNQRTSHRKRKAEIKLKQDLKRKSVLGLLVLKASRELRIKTREGKEVKEKKERNRTGVRVQRCKNRVVRVVEAKEDSVEVKFQAVRS